MSFSLNIPLAMPLAISAIYASILALFLIILAVPVIMLRCGLRVGLGDGGHRSLQQAIRAHGNAAEFIPIFIVLLAILELNRGPAWALHAFGIAFLLARLAHAGGLYVSTGHTSGRAAGVLGTFTVLVLLAGANLWQVIAR
ncbi:MAG TPA: MAPEG family protein [Usitatibacteraceae bacterium]